VGRPGATTWSNTNGEQVTSYSLLEADGTKVIFGKDVEDASPVKLRDFCNASVTIAGMGTETKYRNGRHGFFIDRVTSVTTNAAELQPTAAQVAAAQLTTAAFSESTTNLTVSGILSMKTIVRIGPSGTNQSSRSSAPTIMYDLTTADGTRVNIESAAADAAPAKLGDFVNEPVTLVGRARNSMKSRASGSS